MAERIEANPRAAEFEIRKRSAWLSVLFFLTADH
jgi:hypothetical protein